MCAWKKKAHKSIHNRRGNSVVSSSLKHDPHYHARHFVLLHVLHTLFCCSILFFLKNLLLNKIHYSLLVHRFRDSRCKHGGGRNSHHRYVLTGRNHFISSYSCKLLIISNTWWTEQKQSIRSAHIIFLLHASPPKLLDARPVTLAWPQTSVSTRIRAIHHHKYPQTPYPETRCPSLAPATYAFFTIKMAPLAQSMTAHLMF